MFGAKSWGRGSFRLKVLAAAALIALADPLLLFHPPGATLGVVALAWIAALAVARRGLIRDARARTALALAAGLALVMVDRPGFLAWLLFAGAVTVAALSARVASGEPAWRWGQRVIAHGVVSLIGPLIDLVKLGKARRPRHRGRLLGLAALLALPVIGGAVFVALFASANPLISDTLGRIRLPGLSFESVVHVWFWGVTLIAAASTLRPRWTRRLVSLPGLGDRALPGAGPASVTLSLTVFNLLFAVQNGLDIAFLWSGAPLPEGVTLADYAHRGAWSLIVTALLAGLFVLVFLRPGTETAARPAVRRLVVAWVAQTLLLVASSVLRTVDYVEVYSLTRLRLAAMIWMGLVAVGLGLILWRMLKNRSAHWLIDANVRAALAVLVVLSAVDLGSVAAAWNVRHAREAGGSGVALDLCYLDTLGPSALVSLVEFEQGVADPDLRDRAAWVRRRIMADMTARQAQWRGWTWRDARRLDRVARFAAVAPLRVPAPGRRQCDGAFRPAPPPPVVVPDVTAPLTSPAGG